MKKIDDTNMKQKKLLDHHLFNYIYCALLLSNNDAIKFYSTIKVRNSIAGRHYFEYEQDYEQLLIFLCQKDDNKIFTHLENILSKDYIQQLSILPFQTNHLIPNIENLFIPLIKVYQAIFSNNENLFNTNIYNALEKHKNHYEGEEFGESRRGKPEGWISVALTVACAIAHDKGMKREVESDYIPEWLIKGDFEGLELIVN
jgi:hypothetical protein